MLGAFWQGIGSKLADRWLSTAVGAMVFWGLGVGAVAWHTGFDAWSARVSLWVTVRPVVAQGALLAAALVIVAGSAVLVARMTQPVTRVLEGYSWPFALRWPLVQWTAWRVARAEDRFQKAEAAKENHSITGAARRRSVDRSTRLEVWLRQFPDEPRPQAPERLMPTRLGNVLRAAEASPGDKYGLDAAICWPRLWLCLPDAARQELASARGALDSAVAAWCWALLFIVWAPWQPLALPAGLGIALVAYRLWVIPRAVAFGELMVAAFDLHRAALYTALRWPLPQSPLEEIDKGRELTKYLWRGSDRDKPTFLTPVR